MKKLNKKLVINKETIANLNNEQQFQVLGGGIAETNYCFKQQTDGCVSKETDESCNMSCIFQTCAGETCVGATCCCSLPGNVSCQIKLTDLCTSPI